MELGIIGWIVLGLIAGAIARLLMPGRDPMGFLRTMLLGVGGALIGGFIATVLGLAGVNGLNSWSILLSIGGALLLLAIFRNIGPRHTRWV
jgi:uncharacterized membrane protein YeaQ/YmgE (transglycosylase-associated protein family)